MFGEGALLRLNLLAVGRFGSFAAELEDAAGVEVGLRREGTLAVAYDPGDYAALLRLTAFRRSVGLDAEELSSRACRELEPFLAPDVHGGVLFAGDWSVDNRRYAGRADRGGAGGPRSASCAAGCGRSGPAAAGPAVSGSPGGADIDSAQVVLAAGCWSGGVGGLPDPLAAVFRPVKGQLLRLRHPAGLTPVLSHTVRSIVRGTDVYLVPRADGELIVGATSEERGEDRTVTAGAVHDLLHDAMSVLPVTSELILAEACAGLRPGTAGQRPGGGPLRPGRAAAGHRALPQRHLDVAGDRGCGHRPPGRPAGRSGMGAVHPAAVHPRHGHARHGERPGDHVN